MSFISEHIRKINSDNRKVLSVFLTAGFPEKSNFIDLVKSVIDSGADMIEIGIPFSDPLADGPVIQMSSQAALEKGVRISDALHFTERIKKFSSVPVILMGYANPINKYGVSDFLSDAKNSGVNGLIIPDIPVEEYERFFSLRNNRPDIILITTPTSSDERITQIDNLSKGFVYCVSVSGTTGVRQDFDEKVLDNLKNTYGLIKKNPMLAGFGISRAEDVARFSPYCDGVIVGSAVVKLLFENNYIYNASKLVRELKKSCVTPAYAGV